MSAALKADWNQDECSFKSRLELSTVKVSHSTVQQFGTFINSYFISMNQS